MRPLLHYTPTPFMLPGSRYDPARVLLVNIFVSVYHVRYYNEWRNHNMAQIELGTLQCSAGVTALQEERTGFAAYVLRSLQRYTRCDWGELDDEGIAMNDKAIGPAAKRVLAAYQHAGHPDWKIWIVTEADRSETIILLPEEYPRRSALEQSDREPTMKRQLMTIRETAARYGFPEFYLRRLVKTGEIAVFMSGTRAYITTSEMERYFQEGAKHATPQKTAWYELPK